MEPSLELLTDDSFLEETASFLGDCITPTNILHGNEGTTMAPMLGTNDQMSFSLPSVRDDSRTNSEHDLAVITLRNHREKEKLRRRKQRQRTKDELDGLRKTTHELTLQLKKLKATKELRSSRHLQYFVWKEIAGIQREERLRSEMEHKRLTATAKSQASYIENLREICLVPHGVSTAAFQHDALTDVANGDKTPEFSDMALFESLLHKIDSCYASIDDLLGECGLAELPVGVVTSTHQRDEGGETEFIQHLNKFELPSSFEKTCLPSWKSVDRQHHQHDRKTYKYGSPNDTIAIRYRMVRTLATGTTASVVQRFVARRFIENDRVVCIWKTYTEGEGVLRGMHSDETGWSRLRSADNGSGSQIEACVRQVPVLFNSSESVAGSFHQLLQDRIDEDEREVTRALRNLLLQDMLT